MSEKPPRIQDVARAAGVSTATVSRALSNPDLLTKPTREAVFKAVRSTGYRVNRAARNLRKKSANAILVLVPNLGNPFFSKILEGISEGFSDSDFSVLITDANHLPEHDRRLTDYFLDGRIDGMISLDGNLTTTDMTEFARENVGDRIVFACEWVQDAPMPSVRSDNYKGAQIAIQHLYELGHRRIAHVTGPADNRLTHVRREGMLAERQRLGLPQRPDWIIRGDFSLRSGREAAQRIVAMQDRPSAVFCASDEVAFGLIAGLNAAGLRVPEDISVVGFDDIDQAEHYVPALTTIRQDRIGLGRSAARLLLEQMTNAHNAPAAEVELLDVTLIARDSTAPLSSRAD